MPRGYYPKPSPEKRFWGMVNKTKSCWLWLGKLQDGYGRFAMYKKRYRVHQVSFQWEYGPIPAGLEIDHLCRVRHCVRPNHLEAVTPRVNVRRSDSPPGRHSRQTLCQRGHKFNATDKRGNRYCKTCKSTADANRLRRKKVKNGQS